MKRSVASLQSLAGVAVSFRQRVVIDALRGQPRRWRRRRLGTSSIWQSNWREQRRCVLWCVGRPGFLSGAKKKKRKDPTAAWPFKTGVAGDSPPEFAMAIGGALGRGIAAELALPNVQLLWFASIAAEIRYASLIYTTISRSTQSVFFLLDVFDPVDSQILFTLHFEEEFWIRPSSYWSTISIGTLRLMFSYFLECVVFHVRKK